MTIPHVLCGHSPLWRSFEGIDNPMKLKCEGAALSDRPGLRSGYSPLV
jgi:hypothetical protein